MMGILRAAALTPALVLCGSVQAESVLRLADVSCGDFAKADTASITKIVMWLSGFHMHQSDDASIDFAKVQTQGDALLKYCRETPTAKLSEAADKVMGAQ